MKGLSGETLEALGEITPEALVALGRIPIEVLRALGEASPATLRQLAANTPRPPAAHPSAAGGSGEELQAAMERACDLLKRAEINVIAHMGMIHDPEDRGRNWSWCAAWYDSGGGGVDKMLAMPEYRAAQVLGALGNEVRLAILRRLLYRAKSASELMEELGLRTTGQVYHHLRELETAGFVEAREGRYQIGDRRIYLTALALAYQASPVDESTEG